VKEYVTNQLDAHSPIRAGGTSKGGVSKPECDGFDATPRKDREGDAILYPPLTARAAGVGPATRDQRCFSAWVATITGMPEKLIAIDGKTSCRSGCKCEGQTAILIVANFAGRTPFHDQSEDRARIV
jgi:hypothetical protein